MKHARLMCLVIAVLILAATPAPAHSGEAPSFLQTGKSYNMTIGGTFHENVTIVEIDHGWLKVKQSGREYWLNANFIERIFPDVRKPANR
ncbi:MAG: hypothetical protein WAW37_14420 [Syntrophobacteraceae bacterium]